MSDTKNLETFKVIKDKTPDSPRVRLKYQKQFAKPTSDPRSMIQASLNEKIGDTDKLIANMEQMMCLMFSMQLSCYAVLTDEQKAAMIKEERELIEAAFAIKKSFRSTADVKLETEGIDFVKKRLKDLALTTNIVNGKKINDL